EETPAEKTPAPVATPAPSPALAPKVVNPPIAETEKVKLREKQFEVIQKRSDLNVSDHELRSLSNDRSRSAAYD
ncbi:hypothetical protein A2U01_0104055, partial [Trifolium medium]|nr:hypothetical protein [Trifolium medium]